MKIVNCLETIGFIALIAGVVTLYCCMQPPTNTLRSHQAVQHQARS